MQKYVPLMFISVLFLVTCIAACGGGGGAPTATPKYKLPTSFASYSASKPHLMGGAVQGTPLVLVNTVSTLAGTAGSAGFTNYTGNSSITATFNQPNDITTADGTNFYVADYGNSLIRRISTVSDVVTTTTLRCTDVFTGDGVVFNRPSGITTDGTNLYVVDSGSNTIRVIEIAIDPNTNTNKVTAIIGSTTGLAGSVDSTDKTAVRFSKPNGITTDGINLYVTDYNNATVRWIDLSNNYAVYTLAGTSGAIGSTDGIQGAALFNRPGRITTDGANLYVTDISNRTIRQIVISSGVVSTLAGRSGPLGKDNGTLDGKGAAARFNQPNGITADGANLYVTDSYLNTIRKIVIGTGAVTTIPIPGSSLHAPIGITTDGVSLYVADTLILNSDYTNTYSNSIIRIH